MSFSPNMFFSHIRAKDGLAKPSRFEVVLPIPPYIGKFVKTSVLDQILNLPNTIADSLTGLVNDLFGVGSGGDQNSITSNTTLTRYLSLQCESTELPGRTFQTSDVKIYGPTFKVPYQAQYGDIVLTFLCTNEFYERKLFETWMECINPTDTNNFRYAKDEETRYLTNIKIIQYDELVRQIYAVELIDAFPIGISPQPVNWATNDFHRLSVQFAYQKYRVVYKGTYDVGQALGSLFGSAIGRMTSIF